MLQSLEIKNFTVFEEANLEFSAGLNIIIGENGTGKSQLLKLGYVFLNSSNKDQKNMASFLVGLKRRLAQELVEVFGSDNLGHLVTNRVDVEICNIKMGIYPKATKLDISFNKKSQNEIITHGIFDSAEYPKPIFFPTREIVSIFEGFAAALRNRELAFDKTFLDLADALALTLLKGERAELIQPIVAELEKQMKGKVIVKNGRFYLEQDKKRLEMPLVAEGIRKIAMLTYLIMNGSIQKGSTLFWDEPESNLNPKMMVQLAQTLVTLSSMGIQIFIATHSLFLLREIKIQLLQHPEVQARYFALQLEGKSVSVQQGDSMDEVEPIAALDASLEQSDRYLELV